MRAYFRITIQEDRDKIPICVRDIVLDEGKVIAYDCDKKGHISFLVELKKIEQSPEAKARIEKRMAEIRKRIVALGKDILKE